MRLQWQQEARAKYQISLEQQQEAEAALQALAGERLAPAAEAAAAYQAALLMGDFRKGVTVVPCAAAADAAVQAALQGVDQMGESCSAALRCPCVRTPVASWLWVRIMPSQPF
jgi:hypothetical protein